MTITVIAICLFAILYGLRKVWLAHEQEKHAERVKRAKRAEAEVERLTKARYAQWQPIETAPKDGTKIIVFTEGGSVVLVSAEIGVADDGWVWVAVNEDEHPCCWDDGVCWASNSAEEPSDPPQFWMLPPPDARADRLSAEREQP